MRVFGAKISLISLKLQWKRGKVVSAIVVEEDKDDMFASKNSGIRNLDEIVDEFGGDEEEDSVPLDSNRSE